MNGALQDCNKAIDLDENETEAYRIRAEIRQALGNYGAAVLDLNLAIEIDDSNEMLYFQLANTYFSSGDFKTAIKFYNKAILFNPKVAPFFLQRAQAKQKMNDKSGSCSDFSQAEKLGSLQASLLKKQFCK